MQLPLGVSVAAVAMALAAAAAAALLAAAARRLAGPARAAQWLFAVGTGLGVLTALLALAANAMLGDAPMGHQRTRVALVVAVAATATTVTLLVGLLGLPGAAGPGRPVRHLLDALVIASALWFVGWALISEPTRILGRWTPMGCPPLLLPTAVMAVAAGLTTIVGLRHRAPRWRMVLRGVGVVVVAAAGVGLGGGTCQRWPAVVAFSAVGLPVGLLAVALAGRRVERPVEAAGDEIRRGVAYAFVPVAAMSLAAVYKLSVGDGSAQGFGLAAGIVEGFALVIRQYLSLRDVRRYAARLAEREAHFRELAHTDPLTGLANRRGLLSTLYGEARGGPPCVLLGLDLDGFKNVNDMHGHDVGDAVLIEVGQRLRMNLRPGDLAARLGGDEFAVLMWACPPEAQRVAERLLGVLCRPYEQAKGSIFLSASIGLAGCASVDDIPTLLRNADLALRFAKQRGKARVEQYDEAYDLLLRRRTTVEHELRGAIERSELHLAYQPVVALPSVRPVGAEALLRWHHPTLGTVPPDEFIPVAEECGMIAPLGAWVLHQACHQLSLWLADGHDVWVSVNVSPRELHSARYVTQVAEALRAHRVPPQRLVLEVTEHAVATDLDELIRRLRALRATGVRIALDDFGAGYSSLGQLRNIPVDILKIDHALVAEPEISRPFRHESRPAAPLVDVVVRLGHRLGLEVIAEGVSAPEQRQVVEVAGCRFGQGQLFGRAVPAEHFEAQLVAASHRRTRVTPAPRQIEQVPTRPEPR